MSNKKILIVEDEFSIALDIEARIENLGYEALGIAMDYGEAIGMAADLVPDLILMDINLKGEKTGIDSAISINKLLKIPIVFLTANSDQATFEKAKVAKPYGFVLKPFKDVDIKNAIEIAIERYNDHMHQKLSAELSTNTESSIESESNILFIKEKGQMIKLDPMDIVRLEAMDNYTLVFTENDKKIVGGFLKDVLLKLPENNFIRVHRSHAIAVNRLEKIEDNLLYVSGQAIPISKSYKNDLQARINIL